MMLITTAVFRYANGRVRVRDPAGNLVEDSG